MANFHLRRRKDTGYFCVDMRSLGKGQRSLKTKDKRIAQERLEEIEHGMFRFRKGGRRLIEDFSVEYLKYSASVKAPNTVDKERYALKLFVKLCPEVEYLDELTPRAADRFVECLSSVELEYKRYIGKKKWNRLPAGGRTLAPVELVGKKLSPASVNSYLAAIKSIFGTALRWEYITSNPFNQVYGVVEEEEEARILTLEELSRIIEKTAQVAPKFLDLWEFYLLTGCRRNEALSLEWTDIDLTGGLITFRKTKGVMRKRRKKKLRKMYISPRVREILSRRRSMEKPFDFNPETVTANFSRIARLSNVQGASLHTLRSCFSTYMQEIGTPISFVSWLIGHSDESTTVQSYTGITGEMMKTLVGKLEERLLPAFTRGS